MKPTLYLIPTPLGSDQFDTVFPRYNLKIINRIDYFIVENARTIRRFFSKLRIDKKIADLHFVELNKHTDDLDLDGFLAPLERGEHLGLLSDAGIPAVADPGAEIVKRAHKKGFQVVPLIGPSSILLALMASGLNGQNFAFNGYLPVQKDDRASKLKFYENRSRQEKQTQIFIETPYRNQKLFEDLLRICSPQTRLCLAIDLTLESQVINTQSIADWRQKTIPALHKKPAIFLFLAG
ncbi:MAG: SAM-dependent methyltransferase [Calditrichaeota bacterium]|nr:MAG: SAM-dependent methyltransferase [Calditrichota bacterium]